MFMDDFAEQGILNNGVRFGFPNVADVYPPLGFSSYISAVYIKQTEAGQKFFQRQVVDIVIHIAKTQSSITRDLLMQRTIRPADGQLHISTPTLDTAL